MHIGFILVIVSAVILAGWIDFVTLRSVLKRGWPLKIITSLLILGGIPIGFYCAFMLRYPWSSTLEVLGFPIPVMAFQLQEGVWVDFVGFLPLAVVSWFLVISIFLTPVSLCLLLSWCRARFKTRDV